MRIHTNQRPPQRTAEWYRHLSYRAITEMEEAERADRDAREGRGAAAWAIIAVMLVGAALAGLTIYTTVALAAAH